MHPAQRCERQRVASIRDRRGGVQSISPYACEWEKADSRLCLCRYGEDLWLCYRFRCIGESMHLSIFTPLSFPSRPLLLLYSGFFEPASAATGHQLGPAAPRLCQRAVFLVSSLALAVFCSLLLSSTVSTGAECMQLKNTRTEQSTTTGSSQASYRSSKAFLQLNAYKQMRIESMTYLEERPRRSACGQQHRLA